MNMLTKWMTLLFSIVTLILAGCSDGEKFYGTAGGDLVASFISVTASPNVVGTLETSEVTTTLYDQNGAVMSGETITYVTNGASGGSFLVPVSATGSNTYTAGSTGGVTDTVTVSGAGLTTTVNIGVQTVIADISSLTLSLNPPLPTITAGTTVDIEIAVKDTAFAGVPGQSVLLVISGDGVFGTSKYTTATTDLQGLATVTLTAPTLLDTGSATVTAQVVTPTGILTQDLPINFGVAEASTIQLWATPSSIGLQDTTLMQARVRDGYGNLVSGKSVTFTIGSPSTSVNPTFSDPSGYAQPSFTVATDSLGIASIDYNSDALAIGTDNVVATITVSTGEITSNVPIGITAVSTTIGDITVTSLKPSITADGADSTRVTAIVTDTAGAVREGETVTFTTSAGTLNATATPTTETVITDVNGEAFVTLTSGTSLATANIKATVGGLSNYAAVDFVAGPIAAATMTAVPTSLPADGTSTSTITVALQDANGNPVADGTNVTLYQELAGITDATIASSSATTSGGRAYFSITAATTSGSDTLYLLQDPTTTFIMNYGVGTSSGDPASIQISSDRSQISVAGVGKEETATVTVNVTDGTGAPIGDETYNNLRVSLLTSPNAGEYVSGTSNVVSPTSVSSVGTGNIEIYTSGGQTSFGVQSGTLPGVVEILIEVIDDAGTMVISAIVPQMVIASGPANTIVLTAPNIDAIQNLGGGVYRRVGTAIVTDRYGNRVPDGTVVNLGVLDSVIAFDDDGSTTAGTSTATDTGTGSGGISLFTQDTIFRNDVYRPIQPNDRILLKNANAEDKTRFISSYTDSQITVQKNYINTASDLDYVVGASAIGAQIVGIDHANTGAEVVGYGTTLDGQVTFYVKYPANEQTIHVGCGLSGWACTDGQYYDMTACTTAGKSWVAYEDERYIPNDSAEVYVVASVSESTLESAVTVDKGQFCFASIADWEGGAAPAKMSGSGSVYLTLNDSSTKGGAIRLPFEHIFGMVVIDSKAAGTCTDGSSSDQISCVGNNETWTVTAPYCTDGVSTDQATCEAVPAVWASGICSDGVSTDQATCEANNETWIQDLFDIDTTNLGCITDNPGEIVAGTSSAATITGACTATVDVLGGSTVVSGDKATISWSNGTSTVVEIP